MRFYGLISGLCLLLAFNSSVQADELPVPTVEYSADRLMSVADEQINSQVYHAKGKERIEMEVAGMRMITILRPDKKVMWMVMPNQNMYREVPFGAEGMDADPTVLPDDVKLSVVGPEKLEGVPTTKYQLRYEDQQADGLLWLSEENIPLRMEYQGIEDGEPIRVTVTLENLKIGKQDPALFELPAGYSKLPF